MKDKDNIKSALDNIFEPELEVVQRSREILELHDISTDDIWREFKELSSKYQRLLKYTMKITRIGDVNYKKLMEANEKVREQKQELEKLNQDLRKANATKDKFYSIIAHDLRNPLHFLLFASDMIGSEEGELEEASMRNYIGKVLKTARNLSELLENLLEWSLSQYGDIQCRPRIIDLYPPANEAIKYLVESAEKKQIQLTMDIRENTMVFADEHMVKSIIRNLVSNGVKFTKPGGSVHLTAQNEDDYVRIIVSDTGIGISNERLAQLFTAPGTETSEGTAEEKGSRLGLHLIREFVEKNRGTVHVESELGKGSTFSFTLPRSQSDTL